MILTETERLIIQQFTLADAPFILELLNSPSWIKYIGDRKIKTIEDAEKYLLNGPIKNYDSISFGLSLVKTKKENISIGMCGLIKRDTLKDIDIGFAFLPEFENKGYGFEAASAFIANAKNVLKLNRVIAITVAYNHNSIKLLEKLGMAFEKNIRMEGDDEELMLFGINL
ncbi:MAG: GNAT family N-acetyltransferase [Bacteroidia bacterium]